MSAAPNARAFERALDWYPRGWRARHGAEALGVLLDQAEAQGRSLPTRGERLDLAWHGLLEQLRSARGWVPAAARDRAAAVSLGTGATFAVMMFLMVEWNLMASGRWEELEFGGELSRFGPFASPAVVLYAVWFAALVLALLGASTIARVAVAATIPLAVVVRMLGDVGEMWLRPSWTTLGILMLLAAGATLGRVGTDRRSAAWAAIAAVVALGFCAVPLALRPGVFIFRNPIFLEWPMQGVLSWVVAGAIGLAILLKAFGSKAWGGAILLAVLPWCAAVIGFALANSSAAGELVSWMVPTVLALVVTFAIVLAVRVFGVRIRVERIERSAPRD